MIISYSNNFVVLRVPKTGSTSLAIYFLKSGLIDKTKDICVEEVKDMGAVFEECEQKYGFDYRKYPLTRIGGVHKTFDNLQSEGKVKSFMPCIATIREPLARISSWFNFHVALNKGSDCYKYSDPNAFWQHTKRIFPIQSNFLPEHATLFNTENLHEHVSKYILDRGGKVEKRIEVRKNVNNNVDNFLKKLRPDTKQEILDTYAKDFELWEKAYAVYN